MKFGLFRRNCKVQYIFWNINLERPNLSNVFDYFLYECAYIVIKVCNFGFKVRGALKPYLDAFFKFLLFSLNSFNKSCLTCSPGKYTSRCLDTICDFRVLIISCHIMFSCYDSCFKIHPDLYHIV